MKKLHGIYFLCVLILAMGCSENGANSTSTDSGNPVTDLSREEPSREEPSREEPSREEPSREDPGTQHVFEIENIPVESADAVYNPDQGFYRPVGMAVTPDGITISGKSISELKTSYYIRKYDDYVKYIDKPWDSSKASHEYTQLYHLRMDISAFSKAVNGVEDLEITEAALHDLEEVLKIFREKELNVIIRFCYAPKFGSDADKEPAFEMMSHHIASLSSVLKRYSDVVTAIETGMAGPWGEMHTSVIAKDEHTIPDLMAAFLEQTKGSGIPILVRTPRHLYQYIYKYIQGNETAPYNLKLDDIQSYQISESEEGYRLGMFNDGYLGSPSDTGTYKERAAETAWASHLTNHTPYGGEVIISDDQAFPVPAGTPTCAFYLLTWLSGFAVHWTAKSSAPHLRAKPLRIRNILRFLKHFAVPDQSASLGPSPGSLQLVP